MVHTPREEIFSPDEVACAHVMNRVVRRCFLMGDDPLTGKNYDHRKQWIEDLLIRLSAEFGIDLLAFSIMSNHFHLILRSRPDVVATWDDREVAVRWLRMRGRSSVVLVLCTRKVAPFSRDTGEQIGNQAVR